MRFYLSARAVIGAAFLTGTLLAAGYAVAAATDYRFELVQAEPAGPVDPEVGVIKVEDGQEQPRAIVMNYACHADVVCQNYAISADYPGVACRKVRQPSDNRNDLFSSDDRAWPRRCRLRIRRAWRSHRPGVEFVSDHGWSSSGARHPHHRATPA